VLLQTPFLACILFGIFDALQLRMQFSNPEVPYQVFIILPYRVSILALVGLIGKPTPPRISGQIYFTLNRSVPFFPLTAVCLNW
jgi:simple sugar transport system permease protein